MNVKQAFDHLGLVRSTTSESIKTRYHELCMLAHPDKGGTPEQMATLNEAYQIATGEAAKPVKCPQCNGDRRIVPIVHMGTGAGWYASRSMPCPLCKTVGKVSREAASAYYNAEAITKAVPLPESTWNQAIEAAAKVMDELKVSGADGYRACVEGAALIRALKKGT